MKYRGNTLMQGKSTQSGTNDEPPVKDTEGTEIEEPENITPDSSDEDLGSATGSVVDRDPSEFGCEAWYPPGEAAEEGTSGNSSEAENEEEKRLLEGMEVEGNLTQGSSSAHRTEEEESEKGRNSGDSYEEHKQLANQMEEEEEINESTRGSDCDKQTPSVPGTKEDKEMTVATSGTNCNEQTPPVPGTEEDVDMDEENCVAYYKDENYSAQGQNDRSEEQSDILTQGKEANVAAMPRQELERDTEKEDPPSRGIEREWEMTQDIFRHHFQGPTCSPVPTMEEEEEEKPTGETISDESEEESPSTEEMCAVEGEAAKETTVVDCKKQSMSKQKEQGLKVTANGNTRDGHETCSPKQQRAESDKEDHNGENANAQFKDKDPSALQVDSNGNGDPTRSGYDKSDLLTKERSVETEGVAEGTQRHRCGERDLTQNAVVGKENTTEDRDMEHNLPAEGVGNEEEVVEETAKPKCEEWCLPEQEEEAKEKAPEDNSQNQTIEIQEEVTRDRAGPWREGQDTSVQDEEEEVRDYSTGAQGKASELLLPVIMKNEDTSIAKGVELALLQQGMITAEEVTVRSTGTNELNPRVHQVEASVSEDPLMHGCVGSHLKMQDTEQRREDPTVLACKEWGPQIQVEQSNAMKTKEPFTDLEKHNPMAHATESKVGEAEVNTKATSKELDLLMQRELGEKKAIADITSARGHRHDVSSPKAEDVVKHIQSDKICKQFITAQRDEVEEVTEKISMKECSEQGQPEEGEEKKEVGDPICPRIVDWDPLLQATVKDRGISQARCIEQCPLSQETEIVRVLREKTTPAEFQGKGPLEVGPKLVMGTTEENTQPGYRGQHEQAQRGMSMKEAIEDQTRVRYEQPQPTTHLPTGEMHTTEQPKTMGSKLLVI
ncbi:enolase-phosphatase E1-like [Ambystoma mexicanum]|uniref:enolase-phosphatase E1-like n=1 Tax=Ambystoma mexicanum TaxID=8296 RepID=UPI0037E912C3